MPVGQDYAMGNADALLRDLAKIMLSNFEGRYIGEQG